MFVFLVTYGIQAQITFSGILDSSVSMNAGAESSPAFSLGVEEYANMRFQAKLRERGMFYGAVNLIASAGDYAADTALIAGQGSSSKGFTSFISGDNYIAAVELERLYFRLNFEKVDLDSGLFRLPFGYGQVWNPSDFINPKNPLKPDARPRGILGAALSWYLTDELKLLGFGAAPRDPFSRDKGWLAGISGDHHWEKASVQALYSFETPRTGSRNGIHRAGLSVKADVEVGLTIETLYAYNHEAGFDIDGLSASIGADYSFYDGNIVVLAEYLYNGEYSSTSINGGGGFSNNHYLYTGFTWRFNDFTSAGAALVSCFDDVSFTQVFTLSHDLFQGAVLTITARLPLDRDLFTGNGSRGELGPRRGYFNLTARLRLRF